MATITGSGGDVTEDGDACTLCDLPTPEPPVTDDGVEGRFCCRGCLEAYRTLGDVDPEKARATLRDGDDAGSGDDLPEEADTTYLSVEGMHCATCEAFVESTATDREGILGAEASYPSGLLKLAYDPGEVDREQLADVVDRAGYRARDPDATDTEDQESLGRLLVGLFFGMMSMMWYVLFLYPTYLGADPGALLLDLDGTAGTYLIWNIWLMATIVLFYTGYPILRGAYVSLRAGEPNMDLLIATAAVTAYAHSVLATLTGATEVYFDIAIVIVLAVTIGNRYEDRMRRRAAGRLADITEERVQAATRRTRSGDTEQVSVDELGAGDEVVVGAGERIPVDGTVIEGEAGVDESLITGESVPVRKTPGADAIGGAAVIDGGLVVEVGATGASTLDRLTELLWEVRSTRPGAQRLADRLAAVFVPAVIVVAVATMAWAVLASGASTGAVLAGLTVLVVSCPCALGLATPLAVAAGVSNAIDRGVVLANGEVIERAGEIDVVAFDKTGTLTEAELRLADVETDGDADVETLLSRAAALERFADHPVAAAIVESVAGGGDTESERAGEDGREIGEVTHRPGRGVSGIVGGQETVVGSAALFAEEGWTVPEPIVDRAGTAREAGEIPALIGWSGAARGVAIAGEQPRDGWEDVVSTLAADHRVVVITGDGEEATRRFRDHPGVAEVFAGVPPEAKTEVIERLRTDGQVAMVGDGSNDAPALGAADLGIALERGTKLAADAADAVITTDDITAVPEIFDITATTRRRIRENLGWAFLYNTVAIPLAVAGALNPLFAALAMSASSLLVVANSSRSM
ncbi:MAG: heavy metal translocating P-type ATPase [Halobacteriales archaeon]